MSMVRWRSWAAWYTRGRRRGEGGGRRRKEFLGFLCLCRGAGGKVDKYLTAFPLSRNR